MSNKEAFWKLLPCRSVCLGRLYDDKVLKNKEAELIELRSSRSETYYEMEDVTEA